MNVAADSGTSGALPARRLQSIDIVRGLVMIIMAIDHVRYYAGQPAGGPTAGIFFTRWITNYSAPAFCFFAGTGAFLNGRKLGDVQALSRYLLERGLVLVVLELTVLRASWTFNFDYAHFINGNVIWMLGWCMVLMAGLIRLSTRSLGIFGLVVIFGQDLIRLMHDALPASIQEVTKAGWQFLYFGGKVDFGTAGFSIAAIYSIVPWIGVMAAGYAFGEIMLLRPEERDRHCHRIGLGATALFVVVAGVLVFLHTPRPDDFPVLFQFLGQRKYPASQLFLLMTLGPTIALLPYADRARGMVVKALLTFGKVPMFFYLLHIPLIHAMAMVVSVLRSGAVEPWLIGNHPWGAAPAPLDYRWNLGLLYLVWAIAIAVLYLASRWYGDLKARHRESWLRFI
jgi:uncharacterized membrane protein